MLFWVLIIAAIIFAEITVAWEMHTFALIGLALILAAGWMFGVIQWTWLFANPWTLLIFAGLYIVGGILWGFAKWYFHMLNVKDDLNSAYKKSYEEDKAAIAAGTDITLKGLPPNETYYQYLVRKNLIPKAKNSKWLISIWMAWWPFSVVWTLINDVVRRFYNWIVDVYIKVYDAISAHVFK